MWGFKPYVSVAQRQANAKKKMEKLKKQGKKIEPVEIKERHIAKKFWGKRWCDHLESFADYSNRLPRGRTYTRNGSVCHLSISEGCCKALVSGSSLYEISVKIKRLPKEKWEAIKKRCLGHIGSLLEFLQGGMPDHVMKLVSDQKEGLFPNPKEIEYSCDCPDYAGMCKHVAAVLYGVGNRLDSKPELLFLLRGVDPSELINTQLKLDAETAGGQLKEQDLADIFGLDFEETGALAAKPAKAKEEATKSRNTKKATIKKTAPALDFDRLTGSSIAQLRNWHGLSITEFADKLFVTQATIMRWETLQTNQLKLHVNSKNALKNFINMKQ